VAEKSSGAWVPLVVIVGVTVVVLCFCVVFALLYCMWQARDVGTAGKDAGTFEEAGEEEEPVAVEEPGRKVEKPGTVEAPKTYGPPGVTLANFERIKTGMTYAEVCEIFGCKGTPKTIMSTSPGRPDMRFYKWRDRGKGWAYICFEDGRVTSASQYDLQ
jgi:hypothetical protein